MVLGLLGACADTYQNYGRHGLFTPKPFFMAGLPQGDDSYSIGMRDGCNTAVGTIGSSMLRNHELSLDVNRGIEDRQYYLGYNTGWNFCTFHLSAGPL